MEEYIPWLPLKLYPDEFLDKPSEEITEVTLETQTFIEDMVQTMYTADGIGLSAPQVGKHLRIIVLDCSKDRSGLRRLINPHIVATRGHIHMEEGCLSFPGLTFQVSRAREIDVEAIDPTGKIIKFTTRNLEAVCIQHEIDHLDGITFEKRVSRQVRRHAFRKWDPEKSLKTTMGDYD